MTLRRMLVSAVVHLLAALAIPTVMAATVWVPLTADEPAAADVRMISNLPGESVFHISVGGFFREELERGGTNMTRVFVPGAPACANEGYPALPFVSLKVAIPDAGEPTVEVLDDETVTFPVSLYLPASKSLRREADTVGIPLVFASAYLEDRLYPEPAAVVGRAFILRTVRGTVLSAYPFRYNAMRGELTVSRSMTIRVTTRGTRGVNTLRRRSSSAESMPFRTLFASAFANAPPTPVTAADVKSQAGNMLVVCNDQLQAAMLPFVYWKRQKGIPTAMVSLSQAGSTAANVQRFVRGYYETNGLTYLLLVGDSGQMPALPGTKGLMVGAPADLRYVLLEGDDMYPDAVVSRFPAATPGDVSNMVWRSIAYEKDPSPGADWYHKGAGAAGNTYLGAGLYDYTLTAELRSMLLGFTYTEVDQMCPTNGINAAMISAALNNGRSIVNFIGHGDSVSWNWSGGAHDPNFNTGHVVALTNTNALPFVIIAGCDGGHYTVGTCLAESFLKAGTAGNPVGGIAVHAAFDQEYSEPSWVAQEEAVSQLVSGSLHAVGPMCVAGVIKALDECGDPNPDPPGTIGEEFAEMKHLFGDGSLMLYTATPAAMAVAHDGVVALWRGAYDVDVADAPGALCSLYDAATHTLHGAAFADTNGHARISPLALSLTNSLTLTVTAFNRIPFMDTVSVSTAPPPGVVLQIR